MTSLFGFNIVVSNAVVPNRTLAKDVPVSPEFRVEVDKWMLDFFGSQPVIPYGQVIILNRNTAHCNPATYTRIKGLKP